ncbi:MAG: hypothetical protein RPR40_10855 [Bermanella sp.]
MDIFGLPKRMFQSLEQMSAPAKTAQPSPLQETRVNPSQNMSSLGERLDSLARQFDLKALPVNELRPLQGALMDNGFIADSQVRAQGLLTQLAFRHYQAGPMDVEAALEEHLGRLSEHGAVLADFQEGKHVLNVVRNLVSARQQQTQAA